MHEFSSRHTRYKEMLEKALDTYTQTGNNPWDQVGEAMRYSLLGGGKRIRGVLTLEFSRMCGLEPELALPFACAVEMIHAYSLIHDDLPCMDDDDTRRGKPSCHIAFGEDIALLAGDGLLTMAFGVIANAPDLPPERVLAATKVLSQAAGRDGMIGGQVLDITDQTGSEAELVQLSSLKTGALFQACAKLGCIAAGAGEGKITAAGRFAGLIGLAFQIRDDILDVTADPKELGKPVGSDAQNNKNTFVTYYGLEMAQTECERLLEEAAKGLATDFDDSAFLTALSKDMAGRTN